MSHSRKANRRQFLSGRAAADAVGDWADARLATDENLGPPCDPTKTPYLIRFSRRAMACQFEVVLQADRDRRGQTAALEALDLVEALEAQMTIYRDASEVSRINQSAAARPFCVEPRLFELFERAVEICRETDGAFDMTAGPLAQLWGFSQRQGAVPSEESLRAALARVGTDRLELDRDASTIHFASPGVELDLGAIGKGYALDRCAEAMSAAGVGDYLLQGGRSSVLARGATTQQDEGPPGWKVGIGDPLRPERRFAEIRLHDAALATSGSGSQFFRHEGKRYGHILDPRNGRPAEGVYSVTVVAPDALTADALATAFYILGAERAAEYCDRHPAVRFVMTTKSKSGAGVDVDIRGLDEDRLSLFEYVSR